MTPAHAGDAVDAAFDKWLRTGLRDRYGAVAAAPVPYDLMRLIQDRRYADRAAPAAPSRSRGEDDGDPIRGLAVAFVLSGVFWAGLAVVVRALWW